VSKGLLSPNAVALKGSNPDENRFRLIKGASQIIEPYGTASGYLAFSRMAYDWETDHIYLVFRDGSGHTSDASALYKNTSGDYGATWNAGTTEVSGSAGYDIRDPIVWQDSIVAVAFIAYSRRVVATGKPETGFQFRRYGGGLNAALSGASTEDTYFSDQGFVWGQPITYLGVPYMTIYGKDTGDSNFSINVVRGTSPIVNGFELVSNVALSGTDLYEASIIELLDGTHMMICRVTGGNAEKFTSDDGMETWTHEGNIGFEAHAPYLTRAPNGVLLMGYRAGTSQQSYLAASWDEGDTWTKVYTISNVTDGYPSFVDLPPENGLGVLGVSWSAEATSTIQRVLFRKLYF